MKTIIMNCTLILMERTGKFIYEDEIERQEQGYFVMKN